MGKKRKMEQRHLYFSPSSVFFSSRNFHIYHLSVSKWGTNDHLRITGGVNLAKPRLEAQSPETATVVKPPAHNLHEIH